MKILAPFNDFYALDSLIALGAQEMYMGFCEPEWSVYFGQYSDINRLTLFKETANRYTLKDIPSIVEQSHLRGCRLYITINAPGYTKEQKKVLERYIEYLGQCQVDGVIISIPELVEVVRKYHMQAVASTMCGIYNQDIARFYADLGISRMILPRELSLRDIASIMKAVPEVEYEAFLMRNGCRYSDAYCLGLHGGDCGALCYTLRQGYMQVKGKESLELWQTHQQFSTQYHEFACGQCAIWRLMDLGVSAVKIVGRLDDSSEIAADVAITKRNIEIASQCANEEEYLEKMELPGDLETYCREGLSCYYPEVRFR